VSVAASPSIAFADGVLQIDTPQAKMRIQWRPKPQAEELLPGRRHWRSFSPDFRMLKPHSGVQDTPQPLDLQVGAEASDEEQQKSRAFLSLRAEIPAEIVHAVEPFGSHQWTLMVLLHDQPRAMDLATSNPVLAYCLANNAEFRGTRREAAAFQAICYSHRKQRTILEWLGFPGTESIARLLRRIPPEAASPSLLRRLRTAIQADSRVMDSLVHLQRINAEVLELVTNQRVFDLVTPALLLEVAAIDFAPGEPSLADQVLGGLAILHEVASVRVVAPFARVRQVQRFREDTDAEYHAHQQRVEAKRQAAERRRAAREQRQQRTLERPKPPERPLPSPPIPGTADIIPITTVTDLKSEGKEQRNCVGTYTTRIRRGKVYIYRVMAPERATLAIVPRDDGAWHLSELLARNNRNVRANTVAAVSYWLARHRLSV